MIHLIREITAIAFGLTMLGICFGYTRILLAKSDKSTLVVTFCVSLALCSALLGGRAVYAAIFGPITDWQGVVYNTVGIVAGVIGLQAQYLLIPPEERGRWRWYNAWVYPPSGVVTRVAEVTHRVARLWNGHSRDR